MHTITEHTWGYLIAPTCVYTMSLMSTLCVVDVRLGGGGSGRWFTLHAPSDSCVCSSVLSFVFPLTVFPGLLLLLRVLPGLGRGRGHHWTRTTGSAGLERCVCVCVCCQYTYVSMTVHLLADSLPPPSLSFPPLSCLSSCNRAVNTGLRKYENSPLNWKNLERHTNTLTNRTLLFIS